MNATSSSTPVPTLVGLQRQFLARLRGQPDGDLAAETARGHVSRTVGLNIYTNAYGARLREALEHDHPVLGTYLGDTLWDAMCRGYIAAHPSRVRSLRDFGANLPAYLAQSDSFRAHPEIAELALFERRLLDSFDAADDVHAVWDDLLATPVAEWPAVQVRFHPSLRLHAVAYNSVETWRAIKDGHAPPEVRPAVGTEWALWRDCERVGRFRSLDAEESAAVAHFRNGGDFAGFCMLLTAWHSAESVPMAALGRLRAWCTDGWISRWE